MDYIDIIVAKKLAGGGGGGGTDIIDDNAGAGDTNKVWSADKTYGMQQDISNITPKVVTISGTNPVIVAEANTRYICGEVSTLSFTPPSSGIVEVIFTSGSSVAVLTLPDTVKMPEWFEVEPNYTYEISIMDGIYGGVMSWSVA